MGLNAAWGNGETYLEEANYYWGAGWMLFFLSHWLITTVKSIKVNSSTWSWRPSQVVGKSFKKRMYRSKITDPLGTRRFLINWQDLSQFRTFPNRSFSLLLWILISWPEMSCRNGVKSTFDPYGIRGVKSRLDPSDSPMKIMSWFSLAKPDLWELPADSRRWWIAVMLAIG